jgi:glutaredoxin-like protein NrdH
MYANIAERTEIDTVEEAIEVVVYSKPSCMQCTMTYRALKGSGVPYRIVDLSEDAGAMAFVKELGYLSAPVVVVDADEHWAGFRPDLIDRLGERAVR